MSQPDRDEPRRWALAQAIRDWIHETPLSQCSASADECPDWPLAFELADRFLPAVVEPREPFPSDEAEALNELLRHSPIEGGLVDKVRWLIEDHALLYRVCAERWRALRVIEGPASDGDPYIEVYRAAGGGYEGLQAIARAALQSEPVLDAVSSHRDDEARDG